ncbi:MAG: hypothetical protein OXN97_19180 [Bryobacterales bacterium]|nr:hypothetical protein [Bryobacterales bacterium]
MQLKTILHWVYRLPGFVYGRIRLVPFEEESARPPLRSLRSLHGDRSAVCHFRRPLTTLEPRIPTWSDISPRTAVVRGVRSGAREGAAGKPRSLPWLRGTPRHRRAAASTLPFPEAGCSSAIGAGSSRSRQECALAKLPTDVNPIVAGTSAP